MFNVQCGLLVEVMGFIVTHFCVFYRVERDTIRPK